LDDYYAREGIVQGSDNYRVKAASAAARMFMQAVAVLKRGK
jgi:hypothetical protein